MKKIHIVTGLVDYFMDDHHGVRRVQMRKIFGVHNLRKNAEKEVRLLEDAIISEVEKERLTLEVMSSLTLLGTGHKKMDGQVKDILSFEIEEVIIRD